MGNQLISDWQWAQQNAQAAQAQNNINAVAQACVADGYKTTRGFYERLMTRDDLGIVDQLLDDKVGMEP